jgi:hypothetical protein
MEAQECAGELCLEPLRHILTHCCFKIRLQAFLTLRHQRRTPCGRVHVCMPCCMFLRGRQPSYRVNCSATMRWRNCASNNLGSY